MLAGCPSSFGSSGDEARGFPTDTREGLGGADVRIDMVDGGRGRYATASCQDPWVPYCEQFSVPVMFCMTTCKLKPSSRRLYVLADN